MDADTERMQILERIERGEISVDVGVSLIQTLPDEPETLPVVQQEANGTEAQVDLHESSTNYAVQGADILFPTETAGGSPASGSSFQDSHHPVVLPHNAGKWKRYWLIPMWIGVAFSALGGWLMYLAIESSGFGFWFICATLLFSLGVVAITLSWQSQFSPWLHLRIQQRPGEYPQRIAFSFPLPMRSTAWLLRNFGHHIHFLDSTSLDEILLSIERVTSAENPIYFHVDDEEEGIKFEIFIG